MRGLASFCACAVCLVALIGCRSTTAPAVRSADSVLGARSIAPSLAVGRITDDEAPQPELPALRLLESGVRGDRVVWTFQVMPATPYGSGWQIQFYLDVDENPDTGFYPGSSGCEYVVRGSEATSDGYRVRAVEPSDPAPESGGWGPVVGFARYSGTPGRLEVSVPRAALGGDDGALRWQALTTHQGAGLQYLSGAIALPVALDAGEAGTGERLLRPR